VNTRRAPGGILCNHAEDEVVQLLADASSSHTGPMPREPRPIQLELHLMPANDSLRLDEDQCPPPSRPEPPQYHPEQFVGSGKSRPRMSLFQNAELLPQSHIFQQQIAARRPRPNEQDEQELQRTEHEPVVPKTSQPARQLSGRLRGDV
jgi:hypothetical protein